MKNISLKLTDAEFAKLEMHRGSKTKSDYIRMLLAQDGQAAKRETEDFMQLFQDVAAIRQRLVGIAGDLLHSDAIIALANYLKEVMSISNPPAYANYADRLQELLHKLEHDLEG